jgi:DNA-binding transcriptional ArsR family regulator
MQDTTLGALGNLFLALSDQTRLKLLTLMASGEVSVGFLAETLGESQPKISRHLAYLRSAGLVSTRRDGKWVYYAIAEQNDRSAQDVLRSTLSVIAGTPVETSWAQTQAEQISGYDAYDQPNMTDWRPAEIEVFLL